MLSTEEQCNKSPLMEWGVKRGEQAVCGPRDAVARPPTTYKTLQQLYCEEMATHKKRRCHLSPLPPPQSPSLSSFVPFDPLCLLRVREEVCQGWMQRQLQLQRKEMEEKEKEERQKKTKSERMKEILVLHASNKQKRSKNPWRAEYKQPKKCAGREGGELDVLKVLQGRHQTTPLPPTQPTPSCLSKCACYATSHEISDHLDFRLAALPHPPFNATEATVCRQKLTNLLNRPCVRCNRCGCCSCSCTKNYHKGPSKQPACYCVRNPCYNKREPPCVCDRDLVVCAKREDGSHVSISQVFYTQHPCSVKKTIDGPHTRMANDGYARIKESGTRFNS